MLWKKVASALEGLRNDGLNDAVLTGGAISFQVDFSTILYSTDIKFLHHSTGRLSEPGCSKTHR